MINFSALSKITLTNEIIIIDNGTLTINGSGANVFTIDGGAGTNRIFYTEGASLTISGLTLTGGNGGGATANGTGGAIYASVASLTINSVHVVGNSAIRQGGGGIFFASGTHRIINSTISGNTAPDGSGIRNVFATLAVVNSTISGNTAGNAGGGLYNDGGNAARRDH